MRCGPGPGQPGPISVSGFRERQIKTADRIAAGPYLVRHRLQPYYFEIVSWRACVRQDRALTSAYASVLPAAAFLVGLTSAAVADNLTRLATLTGRCIALTAMDVVTDPSLCTNKVVNIEYPNGRIGFLFTMMKKGDPKPLVVSFFGDGKNQLHIDADTAMQPIDRVHFTFQGSTDDLIVAGSCRFSNPYKGTPARVSCSVDSNQGKFAGDFVSNGIAPNTSQMR